MHHVGRVLLAVGVLLTAAPLQAADWYVAAGSDGDGTKEKPFDDPQRAIEKAVAGDVIHVVQGEYYGKLKIGYIVIEKRGLTLVGGYKDKTFAERDPFKYPTFIKKHPDSKSSTFDGAYMRVHAGNKPVPFDHQGTTVDGFWFDRKDENKYGDLKLTPDKCPGCLGVPLGSNTKPAIWFEAPDCHLRNNVFMNTALYAVRVTGDGSSVENNLFLNTNYTAIDVYGKGEKLAKGYPFPRIHIKGNTFVSTWNCCSLERGAGTFINKGTESTITVTDNIFHLSAGNTQSLGYAIKDERNFKGEKWVSLSNNSFSQLRGGIATVYMVQLNASANIDRVKDLKDTPWDVGTNDDEAPNYKFDKEWFERYCKAIPKQDPSTIKVDMDHYNKMRRMLGLPLDAGTVNLGGQFLALWYPVESVKAGVFFNPDNPKLAGRGVQVAGPFPVVRSPLLTDGPAAAAGGTAAAAAPARDYKKVDFKALWDGGEGMADQAVEFTSYWVKWDQTYGSGFGKKMVPFLDGHDAKSDKILMLRQVPESDSSSTLLRAYVPLGSAPMSYVESNARRQCAANGNCEQSFVVRGVVKKAGAKVGTGKTPQIIITVDSISAN